MVVSTDKSPTAYRTIAEVATLLGVPQHVLRFWETRFPAIQPLKRGGNRRYYRPEDVVLLQTVNRLLYTEGYTIKGVQKLLESPASRSVTPPGAPIAAPPERAGGARESLESLPAIRSHLAEAIAAARAL
ncbi:MAG: MerR family transcriptional regulator [Janthinobacterium lividum]